VRDWVTIPDARLPEPWTCNWSRWPYWTNLHPLEAVLSTRYALGNEPLHPIMFNSFDETTVFACAKTRTFYLYYGPHWYGEYEEILYAFTGVFSSVEAFIEEADWNQVEQVKSAGRNIGELLIFRCTGKVHLEPDSNRHEAGLPAQICHICENSVEGYARVPPRCRGAIVGRTTSPLPDNPDGPAVQNARCGTCVPHRYPVQAPCIPSLLCSHLM
jgi:hypothetical protein